MSSKAAVDVAKEQRRANERSAEVTLSTGYTVRFKPVSQLTIHEAQARIKYPPVPKIYDPEKDRDIENPNHPAYTRMVDEVNVERGAVKVDIALLQGVEIDAPEDNEWLTPILKMEKRGILDLSDFDLTDKVDREYLFKKHIVFGSSEDIAMLMVAVDAISEEAVLAAMENFRRPA